MQMADFTSDVLRQRENDYEISGMYTCIHFDLLTPISFIIPYKENSTTIYGSS